MDETTPIVQEIPKIPFWKQYSNIFILAGCAVVGLLFVVVLGIKNSLTPTIPPQPVPTTAPAKAQVVIMKSGHQDDVPPIALSPRPIAVPTFAPQDGTWKLYRGTTFQLKYPANMQLFVYKSTDLQFDHDSIEQIEITNDPTIKNASLGNLSNPSYTDIQFASFSPEHPVTDAFFTMQRDTTTNTSQPFSLHGYSGKRAEVDFNMGTVELVSLENPKGGHIQIQLYEPREESDNAKAMFEEMLKTFSFP